MTRTKVLGAMHGHGPVDTDAGSDAVRAFVQLAPVGADEESGRAEQSFQRCVDFFAENHPAGVRQQQRIARAADLLVERSPSRRWRSG